MSCVLFCFFSLSLSKSQKTSCWLSLEDICVRQFFLHLSQPLEQDFPTIPPGDPSGFRGTRGTRWHSRPPFPAPESFGPSTLLDPSKVSPLRLRCSDHDSFSPSPCPRVWAAVPSLLVSCSLPVQLYSQFCSHSCDWLVSHGLSPVTFTQWCFGCSSGKRVSMFVLFSYYPD